MNGRNSSQNMKSLIRTTLLTLAALTAIRATAQTDVARELNRLEDDREKAIAAAVEPINRRYHQSLETLLRRATQSGDLDTANKIKKTMETLPQDASKQLVGEWALRASTGYAADVTFRSDGTGTHSKGGRFQWRIEGTTLHAGESDVYYLPIKDGKLKGMNKIGNQLTLSKK